MEVEDANGKLQLQKQQDSMLEAMKKETHTQEISSRINS